MIKSIVLVLAAIATFVGVLAGYARIVQRRGFAKKGVPLQHSILAVQTTGGLVWVSAATLPDEGQSLRCLAYQEKPQPFHKGGPSPYWGTLQMQDGRFVWQSDAA